MKPGQFGGSAIADFDGPAFGLAPAKQEGAKVKVDPGSKGRKSRAAPMVELYMPLHEVKTLLTAVEAAYRVADRRRQSGQMRKLTAARKYLQARIAESGGAA